MGGERETIAPQTKQTRSGLGLERCGTVRYHESKGEVHFHDDTNSLKVAIPSGEWYALYRELSLQTPSSVSFVDHKNQTAFHASTFMKKKKKTAKVELEMYIEPVTISSDLAALKRFTEGPYA